MADVDRRRTRDPAPGKGDYARRAIQSSALPRRASGGRGGSPLKPEKHELDFLPPQPLRTARVVHCSSCWCAQQQATKTTTARAKHRCTTKQPCRFWRQAKIISHRYDWSAARKK